MHDIDLGALRARRDDARRRARPARRHRPQGGASSCAKDYVLWPLLAGPWFLPVLLANLVANMMRNLWSYAIIFCGHFPDGAQVFTEAQIEGETRGALVPAPDPRLVQHRRRPAVPRHERQPQPPDRAPPVPRHAEQSLSRGRSARRGALRAATASRTTRARSPASSARRCVRSSASRCRRSRPRGHCRRDHDRPIQHARRPIADRRRSADHAHDRRARGRVARAEPHDPVLSIARRAA